MFQRGKGGVRELFFDYNEKLAYTFSTLYLVIEVAGRARGDVNCDNLLIKWIKCLVAKLQSKFI